MSRIPTTVSSLAATLLSFSPSAWLKSWLLYIGIQTHVRSTVSVDADLKPLTNVCEYLNALHIYCDEARQQGKARPIEAFHFCSHVDKDFRQCLIYDSNAPNARLIGVEYMVPAHVYRTLPAEERKLWHSHVYEVKSGMLILPTPSSHLRDPAAWERLETQALAEVVGWYGKTFHFWEIDRGDSLPLGMPRLMGSLTDNRQLDIDEALSDRNHRFGVDHRRKAEARQSVEVPQHAIVEGCDSWWEEAKGKKLGVYAE